MAIGRVALVAVGAAIIAVAAKKGKKRVKVAVDAYTEAVASGSKPIEGVGTAIAAFVGLAPGGPINSP